MPLNEARASGPMLPFEGYFAKQRGDVDVLKFNDFSGKIKGNRIKKLLRSGPILGDRVLLQNDTAVYFPDGYIVSMTKRFDKWRKSVLKNNISFSSLSPHGLELNPEYKIIESLDRYLGSVCAEAKLDDRGNMIRIRKSRGGVLSLVQRAPGTFDHIPEAKSQSVIVTSSLNPRYLSQDVSIRNLAHSCL